MNPPTPWPPEVPAGENPPPGAILDYYLASDASGSVTIEILDTTGRVVRTYSSTDPVPAVHPALDPVAYNKLCQETPIGRRLRAAPLLAGAADGDFDARGNAPRVVGHAPRSDRRGRRRPGRWRRGGRAAPDVSLGQLAVGAARVLHRAPDDRRQELHAADRGPSRSAGHDLTGGPGHALLAHDRDVQRGAGGVCGIFAGARAGGAARQALWG